MENRLENFMDEEAKQLLKRYENELRDGQLGFYDVDEYIVLINYMIMQALLTEAMRLVHWARKQYPEDSELKIKQAELNFENGFFSQALSLLQEVEDVEPYLFELYLVRGHILKSLSKYDEAQQAFQTALEKGSDEIDVSIGMAELEILRGEKEKAWQHAKKVIGHPEDAADTCNSFIELATKGGFLPEAIEMARQLAKDNPYKTLYWKMLAELSENAGAYEQAVEAQEFVLAIQPDDKEAMFGKARSLAYAGGNQNPLPFLLKMEKDMTDLADLIPVLCRIAQEYEIAENWDGAMQYYHRMLDYPDTREYALFRMGVISNYRLDFPSALSFFLQAEKESISAGSDADNLSKVYRGIARTNYYIGQIGENLRYNRKAVDLLPNYRYHTYAYVLDACDLGEIPTALEYVEQMLSSSPCSWLYLCKACLYYYGGKKNDSYALFAQAFAGDPLTRNDADIRIQDIYEEDPHVLELRNEFLPSNEDNEPEDVDPYIYYGPDADYLQRAGLIAPDEDGNNTFFPEGKHD